MIVREWRGRADAARRDAYPAHFRNVVMPELRRTAGFLGAQLARRDIAGDRVEFLVLTRWASLDAVRAFAGTPIERAVVEPGAVAALVDFDAAVQHYELVDEVSAV